jgi:hypothetical protein
MKTHLSGLGSDDLGSSVLGPLGEGIELIGGQSDLGSSLEMQQGGWKEVRRGEDGMMPKRNQRMMHDMLAWALVLT